jgi:hypothetical protein
MSNDNTSILESLARIEEKFIHQTEANQDIKSELEKLRTRMYSIEATLNQAKGGWVAIIAIPAVITALVNFFMKSH